MNLIGELAGLATSFFFSITMMIFTTTGRMVGSEVTNRVRLLMALVYLAIVNFILYGEPLPFSADPSRWVWLGLSGLIGFSLGDAFFFYSLVSVGARLGSLLMSLAPIFGSIIAWVFFGETLTAMQILGIGLALSGISWVVSSHVEPPDTPHGHTRRGVFFGVLAALGQAIGLVLSKQGMFGNFPAFEANAIRVLSASFFTWGWAFLQGSGGRTINIVRENPRALWLLAIGAFTGPLLGVSASLLSVQNTEVGVASTLMALPPVIILPISYFYFKEKVGWQAVAGTILAIAGVAVLFLA